MKMLNLSKKMRTLLVTMLFSTVLGACATIEGAGEDIESAGEAVQDAAND